MGGASLETSSFVVSAVQHSTSWVIQSFVELVHPSCSRMISPCQSRHVSLAWLPRGKVFVVLLASMVPSVERTIWLNVA